MTGAVYDIGNLREDHDRLYSLCILTGIALDFVSWDTESECFKVFRDVVNSLWSSLPPIVTIDFRDPDAIGLSD